MNFTSLWYILFLAFTVSRGRALPHRLRTPFLLIMSYLFFVSQSGLLFFVMLGETVVTYFAARMVSRA